MVHRARKTTAVTIKHVANESGFSPTTVSIVLNSAPLARYIPAATKTKIEQAAKRLGYRPNLFARSLRSNRSHTIGVMVFDVLDPYCTPILRGIENSLYQESYLPILTDVQNERTRFERYLEMLLARRVEGLVVVANWLFTDIELIADLQRNSIPTVLIGRELEGDAISSVTVDNYAGGVHALEHLHAFGHRDIAIIRGPKTLSDSRPRWEGIRHFARSKRMTLAPDLVVQLPESQDPMSGFEFAQSLIGNLIRKKKAFSAVLAFDDMAALGAMRALAKAGIRVPAECSVIGFDDISTAALNTPALSTIRQPMEAMGATAVYILLESLQAAQQGRTATATHRKLVPELIVRDSTAALKRPARP